MDFFKLWSNVLFKEKVKEPPPDLPEVVNDFDIEEEEIAIENR